MVSKSRYKATECEKFFAEHYLVPWKDRPPEIPSGMADTGKDFHHWRAWCVARMADDCTPYDQTWNQEYLKTHTVTAEARELIEDDWPNIDPETILAAELYLTVGRNGEPLTHEPWSLDELPERHPDSWAGGIIDLALMIDAENISISDYKTGWSTSNIMPDEGVPYAMAMFAHYPSVQTVYWQWDFVRLRLKAGREFTRDQFDSGELAAIVESWEQRQDKLRAKFDAGESMTANPFASSCAWCGLACEHRQAFRTELAFPPPATDEDARRLAGIIQAAKKYEGRARDQLHAYLAEHGGSIAIDGDTSASLDSYETRRYPLRSTLAALGVELPEKAVDWDVPLDSLTISGTELNRMAKTKKRVGMLDAIGAAAQTGAQTKLNISRATLDEKRGAAA